MISSVLSRLLTIVIVIGGRKQKQQHFSQHYKASCLRRVTVVNTVIAWLQFGLYSSALQLENQTVLTMESIPPSPPKREQDGKIVLNTSKHKRYRIRKGLTATQFSNSNFFKS